MVCALTDVLLARVPAFYAIALHGLPPWTLIGSKPPAYFTGMRDALIAPPFYGGYVDRVDGDVFAQLRRQQRATPAYLRALPADRWAYRYAPGKWTLWQSWRHVVDTERIMATRALCLLRGDDTPLPGYDQDAYAATYTDVGDVEELLREFDALRTASLLVLAKADEDALLRPGTVSGKPMNAAALCYVLAGHEAHHVALTETRYLG